MLGDVRLDPFPSLHRLRVFTRVIERGGVSRAAEELYLSQPAVTHHIRRLEREVGVRLFERRGRSIVPTPAAQVLYRYASTLLNVADELQIRLQELQHGREEQFTLGASNSGLYYVVPLLRTYHQAFPHVRVSLRLDVNDRIREQVASGAIDVAIIAGPVQDSRLQSRVLDYDLWIFMASPDHPLAARERVPVEALVGMPFILPPRGTASYAFVCSRLKSLGVTPKAAMYRNSTEAIKRAVESGIGITLLSATVAEKELREGVLRDLRVEGAPFPRPIVMVWARGPAPSPVVKALLDMGRGVPPSRRPGQVPG